MILRLKFLLGFIIFSISTIGQSSDFVLDHIGYAEGLSSQLVRCIKEDNNGHLWIATFNELNKYNGFETKIFDPNNSNINNGFFIDLLKDAHGRIWALQTDSISYRRFRNSEYNTYSYQLSIVEPETNKIEPIDRYFDQSDIIVEDLIWVFQREEIIYLINKTGKVLGYDGEFKNMFSFDIDDQFVGITNDRSYYIINEENTLQEFDFDNNLLKTYDDLILADNDRVTICENGNILYMDRSKGYFDGLQILVEGKFLELPDYHKNLGHKYDMVKSTFRNVHSKMIGGENGASLIRGHVYFPNDTLDIYTNLGLDFHAVTDLERSSSGTYYLANDIGVSTFQKKKVHFKYFNRGETKINSVRGMIKYDDIIFSTGEDGKIYVESPDGSYDVDFINNKTRYARGYYRDVNNKDLIWICGYVENNLHLIDLKAKKIIIPENFPWNNLNNFFYSKASNTFYVYGENGLFKNLSSPMSWTKEELGQHKISVVNHVIEIADKLYLATNEGLLIFDEFTKDVKLIPIVVDDNLSKITYIHPDKSDEAVLWLGTSHNGVLKYNIKKDTFTIISTSTGLSNNAVHAILEDELDRLWISTNKYLNCLDKNDNSIYIFTTSDGLSHEEFNKFSYYTDPVTGEFYFGGLDGYNYFDPNEITLNDKILSNINIAEGKTIKTDGTEYYFDLSDLSSNYININEDDVIINFTFTLNNIFKAKNRKFYYRIKEINNTWTKLDGNNLSITKLPYGEYTLEVVSDKYSSRSQSNTRIISLHSVRPFYKSSIFIIVSILLFLLLAYLWYRNRTKRIIKKNKELEEQISARTKELQVANETKNKILAILSHDLKSPMGGLRDYYEKLEYLLKKDRLEEIKEISSISKSRIQNLEIALENLLNWALAESKTLKTKEEQLSLNYEVDAVLKLFDHIKEKKNLKIENNLEVMDQVMIDKNILQTILRNIIHNALKFSYPDGKVIIEKTKEDQESILISIRDFGIGMDQSSLKPELLSRLDADKGLGFGLSTSKDLAQIGNIGLLMESEGIEGTNVILTFPKLSSN